MKRSHCLEEETKVCAPRVVIDDDTETKVSSISNGSCCHSSGRTSTINASIVEDYVFVVEVMERGCHIASLLMKTSETQFYDVRGSDTNPHFHTLGSFQQERHLDGLNFGRKGEDMFVEITNDVVPANVTLPKRYYIILKSDVDYNLKYATVRNNIQNDERLNAAVNAIPFQYMADEMFLTDEGKAQNDDVGERGNHLWNAGYTQRNCTDCTTEPGMNIPDRMTALSKRRGYGDDQTLEHTAVRGGCTPLHMLSQLVHEGVHRSMPMAEPQFVDTIWHDLFTKRWGEALGFNETELSNMVFTGCSVFGTGETNRYSILKTENHTDPGNSSDRGHDHSATVVKIATVRPGDCPPFKVRTGMNICQEKLW